MLSNRVNNRGVPKSLAGVPVSRETLERIKLRVSEVLPVRPLERPLSDLLAAAYMAGIVDGAAGRRSLADGPLEGQDGPVGAPGMTPSNPVSPPQQMSTKGRES
jgi:hypothetical protein